MAGFIHYPTQHGQLVINGISLMSPAIRIVNLPVLWSRTNRGSSVTIPNSEGRKSRPMRRDEMRWQLDMIVRGDVTTDGTPVSNSYAELDTTMSVLTAYIAYPPTTDVGWPSTLTLRNGTTLSANVFVDNWDVNPDPTYAARNRVSFTIVSATGAFA